MPNKVEKLPDGTLEVALETGEIFKGDPLEVTQKMAEAHVSTKRWGQEWKQKAETVQPPNTTNQTTNPPADPQEAQLQEYLLNQTAKALGYTSGDEYKADLAKVKGTLSSVAQQDALTKFFTSHPEYPGTEEANATIGKIFDEKGWTDMTAENLHLAHLEAIYRHQRDPKEGYEPLSAETVNAAWANNMQQSSHRQQAAPPMLRGNNPEAGSPNQDPYAMPLDQLRKQAIQQQLGGNK